MNYFYFFWIFLVIAALCNLWIKKPKLPLTSGKAGITVDFEVNPTGWNKAAIKITFLGLVSIIIFTIPLLR